MGKDSTINNKLNEGILDEGNALDESELQDVSGGKSADNLLYDGKAKAKKKMTNTLYSGGKPKAGTLIYKEDPKAGKDNPINPIETPRMC